MPLRMRSLALQIQENFGLNRWRAFSTSSEGAATLQADPVRRQAAGAGSGDRTRITSLEG